METGEIAKQKIKQYEDLIDTIPHGIQENDINGKITFANTAHCQITGYSYTELTKMYIWDLMTNEADKKQLKEYFEYLVKKQPKPTPYISKNRTKDGRIINIKIDWTYKRDDSGKLTGFISIITDITGRMKSEQKASTIIRTALDGFWIVNMKGEFLEVNDSYCSLIGYTQEELLKMSIPQIEAAENPEETAKHIEKIKKQGYDRFETKHKCKDGRIIDVEVSVNYLEIDGGQHFVFLRDITERKKQEAELHKHKEHLEELVKEQTTELRESEERWKSLVMNAPDIIMLLDREAKIKFVNYVRHGLTAEDVIGKSIYEFMLPEHHDIAKKTIAKVIRTGKPANYEIQVGSKIKDRNWYRTIVSPIFSNSRVNMMVAITSDITDRKKTEIALAQEKERLAVTLNSIGDAVIATDTEGKITLINGIAQELTGYKDKEAIRKPLTEVFHIINENTRKKVTSPVDKVLKQGIIIGLANHTALLSRNGEEIPIEDSGAPIKDKEGIIIGVVLVFRDVREKRKSMKKLKEAEGKVQRSQKLALVGKLSSSIAHELRNPLGAIKNAQYFLKKRFKTILDPEKHDLELKILYGIEDEVNRCNRIITDLLDFSRQKQLKLSPVKIKSVIDNILNSITIPIKIKLDCSYDTEEDIYIDAEQLEYAFSNIIINAIQSIPRENDGIINIKASIVYPQPDKKLMQISFQDNGCGIPEKIKDDIFEPLVSTKTKGTGLGLAIVKNIIDAHKGEIIIQSQENKGTIFKVLLPME